MKVVSHVQAAIYSTRCPHDPVCNYLHFLEVLVRAAWLDGAQETDAKVGQRLY